MIQIRPFKVFLFDGKVFEYSLEFIPRVDHGALIVERIWGTERVLEEAFSPGVWMRVRMDNPK